MGNSPNRFRIDVADCVLSRISAQLEMAEVGYAPTDDENWKYGTDATFLRSLLNHWRDEYSWRDAERELNRWPHFKARIDGLDIHFIHVRAKGECHFPLILTHGWPGSFAEFLDVILPLTERGFDVVVPSLPGYGFSSHPALPIGRRKIADIWRALMVDVLGYRRFGAQGGDWGSTITTELGRHHGDVVAAIHLNFFSAPPPSEHDDPETVEWRLKSAASLPLVSAYMMEHATKPQTIGLALAQSPLAFAAWVVEKFHDWSDIRRGFETRYSLDHLITNIMIYLVNDAVQSSIWLYRSLLTEPVEGSYVSVPTGCALFPAEFLAYPPRSAAERAYAIRRWTLMPAGGHFAAMEEPDSFAAEVASFFEEVSGLHTRGA